LNLYVYQVYITTITLYATNVIMYEFRRFWGCHLQCQLDTLIGVGMRVL